jgi:hypothetical protein
VKRPEHIQVREALDVRQASLEVLTDVEDAFRRVPGVGSLGNLRGQSERGPRDPNGYEEELHCHLGGGTGTL